MDRQSNNIFYLMGGSVLLGILLQAVESAAHLRGLELRTFIQMGKGIYLWCVLPIFLLFSVHTLWKQALEGKRKALRGVVVLLGIVVIMAVGFCRGVTYLFTDEMVEETVLDNGDIEGRYSGFLEESRVRYYHPVAGIFRKPFAARSNEDLLEKVRTQYPAEAEETYPFQVPDRLEQNTFEEHREEQAGQEQEELQFIQHYQGDYAAECSLPDGSICYRMVVMDAAAGSRLYGLLRSLNGGSDWEVVSLDPFHQKSGMEMEFIFLNEELGFAVLMQNGGDDAELFVTEDGGRNYTPVVMEGYVVTLDNGYTYEPFDYPEMPYEEDGVIYVQCGQGLDGDYDGGDAAGLALYRSVDGGHTFTFVEREQASGQRAE